MINPNIFYWRPKCGAWDRIAEAYRRSERRGNDFAGLEGHSVFQEALAIIAQGSWRPYTSSLES